MTARPRQEMTALSTGARKLPSRLAAVLAATLFAAGAGAADPPDHTFPEFDMAGNPMERECDHTGRLDNWGFSVEIPPGHVGCNHDMHDTLIPLGERSLRHVIHVSGFYNMREGEDSTVDKLMAEDTDLSGDEDRRQQARVVSRKRVRLAGVPAARVVVRYTDPETGAAMIRDTVHAFSVAVDPDIGAPRAEYLLILQTLRDRYEKDRIVFEAILHSARVSSSTF